MNKKVGIIVSIIIIIIVIATLGFLYFMTDTFKSNKQLFWQYSSSSSQLVKMISSENAQNQKAWKESHSYTSKGDLSISLTKETGTKTIKLGTTTKHNQNTGRTYSDMTLHNGENELLKGSYINSDNIYALYCKDIYEPYYIGLRKDDLKELASKLEIDERLTKILAVENINDLTELEMKCLLDAYAKILSDSIPNEKYTKTQKNTIQINDKNYEVVGYRLQLNQEDIKQILKKLLNKTKEDEQILNILDKIIYKKESNAVSIIEEIESELETIELSETNITITVYNVEKNLTKIQINYNEEMEYNLDIDESQENKKKVAIKGNSKGEENANGMQMTIEKQMLDNMTLYITNISDNKGKNKITMNTSLGNISNDKIENSSKITIIDDNAKIETSYYQTIQAETEQIDIQELTNQSAVIINNYPKEQLDIFFNGIEKKIEEVIPDKMGQLNIQMTDSNDRFILFGRYCVVCFCSDEYKWNRTIYQYNRNVHISSK